MNRQLLEVGVSGVPLYQQVKQVVLAALAEGEWKQGEAIPSERELASRFQVSIGTLRKAIDELAADNILVRHQGRGTFVAIHNRNEHFFKFFRVVGKDSGKTYPVAEFLTFKKRRASVLEREKLLLKTGAEVYEFAILQKLNGDKAMVEWISVPVALFKDLALERLQARKSTLYNFYQYDYGINVIDVDERVQVGRAGASAPWLGVDENAPMLEIRRVAFSYNNQPVEWRVSVLNTENYEYLGKEFITAS